MVKAIVSGFISVPTFSFLAFSVFSVNLGLPVVSLFSSLYGGVPMVAWTVQPASCPLSAHFRFSLFCRELMSRLKLPRQGHFPQRELLIEAKPFVVGGNRRIGLSGLQCCSCN
jgi:hypothetical protein